MLDAMSPEQFERWQEYAGIEPWDEGRADLRAGIVAATFANAFRAPGAEPCSPLDFMPEFSRGSKTAEEERERDMAEFQRLFHKLKGPG